MHTETTRATTSNAGIYHETRGKIRTAWRTLPRLRTLDVDRAVFGDTSTTGMRVAVTPSLNGGYYALVIPDDASEVRSIYHLADEEEANFIIGIFADSNVPQFLDVSTGALGVVVPSKPPRGGGPRGSNPNDWAILDEAHEVALALDLVRDIKFSSPPGRFEGPGHRWLNTDGGDVAVMPLGDQRMDPAELTRALVRPLTDLRRPKTYLSPYLEHALVAIEPNGP